MLINCSLTGKEKIYKRIALSIMPGTILGIFYFHRASVRIGWQGNKLLIFALWYNRLIIGLLIGLAGNLMIINRDWIGCFVVRV